MSLDITAEDRRDTMYVPIDQSLVRWLYNNQGIIPNNFWQRIKDMHEALLDYDQPDTIWYVNAAYEYYTSEGSVEVDSNALVSKGEDAGAYVQAWVWVYNEHMPKELLEQEDYEDHE